MVSGFLNNDEDVLISTEYGDLVVFCKKSGTLRGTEVEKDKQLTLAFINDGPKFLSLSYIEPSYGVNVGQDRHAKTIMYPATVELHFVGFAHKNPIILGLLGDNWVLKNKLVDLNGELGFTCHNNVRCSVKVEVWKLNNVQWDMHCRISQIPLIYKGLMVLGFLNNDEDVLFSTDVTNAHEAWFNDADEARDSDGGDHTEVVGVEKAEAARKMEFSYPKVVGFAEFSFTFFIVLSISAANCGDSKAILCRGSHTIPLTEDHKFDREDELERITKSGGRVVKDSWGTMRVNGNLAMLRAIGEQNIF
ncbi:putative protein phosphatase 2C 6 [Artemisia annua]|uniref:PPM-type phosphatase domain-containing protein n=1 Tax=Artemisia annua TaxID=35608 RepID=A0A2U1NYD0_ARTAN|nr:putative protein phosphatase 2C 6 [Artemisia annua]